MSYYIIEYNGNIMSAFDSKTPGDALFAVNWYTYRGTTGLRPSKEQFLKAVSGSIDKSAQFPDLATATAAANAFLAVKVVEEGRDSSIKIHLVEPKIYEVTFDRQVLESKELLLGDSTKTTIIELKVQAAKTNPTVDRLAELLLQENLRLTTDSSKGLALKIVDTLVDESLVTLPAAK